MVSFCPSYHTGELDLKYSVVAKSQDTYINELMFYLHTVTANRSLGQYKRQDTCLLIRAYLNSSECIGNSYYLNGATECLKINVYKSNLIVSRLHSLMIDM